MGAGDRGPGNRGQGNPAGVSMGYWRQLQARQAEIRRQQAAEQAAQQAAEQAAQQQQQQQQQRLAEEQEVNRVTAEQEEAARQAAAQQAAAQKAEQDRLAQIEAQRLADAQAAEAQRQAEAQRLIDAQTAAEQASAAEQAAAQQELARVQSVESLNRPAPQLPQYRGYTPMDYDASKTGSLTDWYGRMLNVPVAQPFMAQSQIQGPSPETSIFGIDSLLDPVTLKKGGRVRMQEGGGLPALGSFIPVNDDWGSVYSWHGGAPRPELYGQTLGERMSTASDFWGGLSPDIQRAAAEAAWQPRDFGYSIGGGHATGSVEQWRRDVADKMGVLSGLLGDTEYGDIAGVLQEYAKYTGTPPPQFGGQGGANEQRYAQWMGKKQTASDHLAYLLDQQRLAGQQQEEEAAQQQQQQEEQAAADAAAQQAAQQAAAQQVLDDTTLQNIQDQRVQDAQAAEAQRQAAAQQPADVQALDRPAPRLPQYTGYTPMQYDASRTGALTDWYARMLNVPWAAPFMAQSEIQGPSPETSIFGLESMLDPVTLRKGGRVGRMGGGMMIIEDNDVVNNGIGGILSKYKEIRSEL
jgi:hypothetical protein